MTTISLSAEKRDLKANNNRLRKEGKIPAVLYGYKVENTPVAINLGEFEKVLRKAGANTVVELSLGGGKSHHVLIQDVHMHGVKHVPIHADFLEVNMTEKITATVPLEFIGEADAVKVHGGTLVKTLTEVEVEALPSDLPQNIEVDISALKTFDDQIAVKDIKAPAKSTITTDGEEMVAKVQPPRDVEAELAAEPVEDISKVEGAAEAPKAEATAADDKE